MIQWAIEKFKRYRAERAAYYEAYSRALEESIKAAQKPCPLTGRACPTHCPWYNYEVDQCSIPIISQSLYEIARTGLVCRHD